QQFDQLLTRRLQAVMFFLPSDVSANRLTCGRANGERGVPLLPCEIRLADDVVNPNRSGLFQLAHEIRQAMRSLQANQEMNVVADAADALRKSIEAGHNTAKVFVKSSAPHNIDRRSAVFGGENEVIMQAQKGGSHWRKLRDVFGGI